MRYLIHLPQSWYCVVLLAAAAILPATAAPGFAADVPKIGQCEEFHSFNAAEYWFWHGYFGVAVEEDHRAMRRGRLADEDATCFEVARSALDDPKARSRGYRRAFLEWLDWLEDAEAFEAGEDEDFDHWEKRWMAMAKSRLRELTGLKARDYATWLAWSRENSRYLVWSLERETLVVDKAAKAAERPVHAAKLSGSQYWYHHALGQLSELREEGGVVRGERFLIPHGGGPFRIDVATRDDLAAKRQGLIYALDYLVSSLKHTEDLSPKARDEFLGRLTSLTDQTFAEPAAWIAWWREHRATVVLDREGERLTASQR